MQLTSFDRWLREKYVYETRISTLSPVVSLPSGIRSVTTPDTGGKRYKHLYIAASSKCADALIAQLRSDNQMYTTEVVDRKAWYTSYIAPKNKSVTWSLISTTIVIAVLISAVIGVKTLLDNPEIRANLEDSLKLFKS